MLSQHYAGSSTYADQNKNTPEKSICTFTKNLILGADFLIFHHVSHPSPPLRRLSNKFMSLGRYIISCLT